ncbi:Uncharacterised protein [Mycobacterium tuberculosis]|nr:Uncharacterised protein [Mycobacterium tuberculosis]
MVLPAEGLRQLDISQAFIAAVSGYALLAMTSMAPPHCPSLRR